MSEFLQHKLGKILDEHEFWIYNQILASGITDHCTNRIFVEVWAGLVYKYIDLLEALSEDSTVYSIRTA
jgi:hypothetical protein